MVPNQDLKTHTSSRKLLDVPSRHQALNVLGKLELKCFVVAYEPALLHSTSNNYTTYKTNLDSVSVNQFKTTSYQTKKSYSSKLCGYKSFTSCAKKRVVPSTQVLWPKSFCAKTFPVYFIIGE